MNQEFKKCLDDKKIIVFPSGKALAKKELSSAESDLEDAKMGFSNKRYKWSTIQAYYTMFHAARALIYSRNYREKSHHCLAVALRALFVEDGILETQMLRDFINAMNLREAADYESEFSDEGAKAIITSAEKFIKRSSAILGYKEGRKDSNL